MEQLLSLKRFGDLQKRLKMEIMMQLLKDLKD